MDPRYANRLRKDVGGFEETIVSLEYDFPYRGCSLPTVN